MQYNNKEQGIFITHKNIQENYQTKTRTSIQAYSSTAMPVGTSTGLIYHSNRNFFE